VVGVANARDGRSVYLVPTDAVRATVTDLYAPLARSMIAVLGELDDHQRRGVRLWLLGSIDALRSAAGSLET
jgi:hypothetical protein